MPTVYHDAVVQARLDQARLDQARLGQARLGLVFIAAKSWVVSRLQKPKQSPER